MMAPDKLARAVRGILLAVALALVAWCGWIFRNLPVEPLEEPEATAPAWPASPVLPDEAWRVVKAGGQGPAATDGGPLAGRFRLAGTFFLYGESPRAADGEEQRQAILDDLAKNQQHLVREGERLDEYEVVRVYTDRVTLRSGATEYELSLSFAGAGAPVATNATAAAGSRAEDQPALETSRFGKRVGANRWVFSREELLRYYREVLDEPERIAALYLSLKPDYQENQIAGYKLDEEGEGEFFKAAGLQSGDVIRRVNSMRMVSQRRAEYFIGEFLKDRMSALVIDIEREGKPEKLIYLIR